MGNCKSSDKAVIKRKITLAILGLDNAGKTLMAKGLKGETPDNTTPTIGFSSITFKFEGNEIVLYDLGGGKNIRDIWKKYFYEVYGIVFVIDASNPKRLKESQEEIINLLSNDLVKGKPLLVFANKQDVKGAMDEKDICDNLCLEDLVTKHQTPCKVESCSALLRQDKNKLDDSINVGLQWMMKIINLKWEELSARVANDIDIKNKMEDKEKRERIDRVKRSREIREEEESKSSSRNRANKSDDDNDLRISKNKLNPWRPLDQHIAKIEDKGVTSKQPVLNGKQTSDTKLNSSYSNSKTPATFKSTPRLDKLQLGDHDLNLEHDQKYRNSSGIIASNGTNGYKPNGILSSSATPRKSATLEDLPKMYLKGATEQKVVKKTRFNNRDHHQLISDYEDVTDSDNDKIRSGSNNRDSYRIGADKKSADRDKYGGDKKLTSSSSKGTSLLQLHDSDSEEELKPISNRRFDLSEDDDDDDRYQSTNHKTDYRKTSQYSR